MDQKKIWEPIEVLTINNRLLFIELENNYQNITIDYNWDKILGDSNIIFEFNPGESKEYKLIGTVNQCQETPELLNGVIEVLPKYEEVWVIPEKDNQGWVEFEFIDDTGRKFKQMGRDKKYRRIIGEYYINYNIPYDVIEYFPLNSATDSLITLMRKNGIHQYPVKDYLIIKEINFKPEIIE